MTAKAAPEILALAKQRVPPREIRKRLGNGTTIGQVYNVIRKARLGGENIPKFATAGGRPCKYFQLHMPTDLKPKFEAEADRRGISVQVLCKRLLIEIASDDLFDAVLDDQDPENGASP